MAREAWKPRNLLAIPQYGQNVEDNQIAQTITDLCHNIYNIGQQRIYVEGLISIREAGLAAQATEDADVLLGIYSDLKVTVKRMLEQDLGQDIEHLQAEALTNQSAIWTKLEHSTRRSLREQLQPSDTGKGDLSHLQESTNIEHLRKALAIYQECETLPTVLNIFSVMVEPLISRFKYHFESRRSTNRLDKPEWPLQHVTSLVEQFVNTSSDHVQTLLDTVLPGRLLIATHEFLRALLPVLESKMEANTQLCLDDHTLLVHIIDECKHFDDTVREDFDFHERDHSYWDGLVEHVVTEGVFEHWLQVEDVFVMDRYHAIVDAEDAFEIAPDHDVILCDVAPNPSCLKLIDLVEAMAKQFSPVRNLKHRSRFVECLQVALLDSYLRKIQSSTDTFEELTHGFSGGFPNADVAGLTGLRRLFRQLSGASNVLDKLKDWSEIPYYIEITEFTGTVTFAQQIQEYSELCRRIKNLITMHLERELTQELRAYSRLQTWSSLEASFTKIATTNTSSPQLIPVYETITSLFTYLISISSGPLIARIYQTLAHALDLYLWTNILSRHKFSRRGALQFRRDILQLWFTFTPFVAKPEIGMPRMKDVLLLLSYHTDESEVAKMEAIRAHGDTAALRSVGIRNLSTQEVSHVLSVMAF